MKDVTIRFTNMYEETFVCINIERQKDWVILYTVINSGTYYIPTKNIHFIEIG